MLGLGCGFGLCMPHEQREDESKRHTNGQEQRGFETRNKLVPIQPKNQLILCLWVKNQILIIQYTAYTISLQTTYIGQMVIMLLVRIEDHASILDTCKSSFFKEALELTSRDLGMGTEVPAWPQGTQPKPPGTWDLSLASTNSGPMSVGPSIGTTVLSSTWRNLRPTFWNLA